MLQGQHISSDKSRDVDFDIAEGTTILIEEHTNQDRDGHSTAIRSINQILKENALYQSKNVNSNTQDQHLMKDGILGMTQQTSNLNTDAMNFETTQKNLYESNENVPLREEEVSISPEKVQQNFPEMASTTTRVSSLGLANYPTVAGETPQIADQNKKSFCSLFVIFGLDTTKFIREDFKEEYSVLGSYPNLDQFPEVASDHKFVQDLSIICFPEVDLKPERFHLSKMDAICRCSFFHFITTNDMGDKKYLTSVHFKEILLSEKGAFVIDKAICVASNQPIFTLQRQVLDQIYQKVVIQNNSVSIKAFQEAQRTYDGLLDEFDQPPPEIFPDYVRKFMMDKIMCTANRKIRDRSSPSRSNSPTMRHMANVASLPTTDFSPILELYISIFSKHLYYDAKVERDIHIILTENVVTHTPNPSYNSNLSMFTGARQSTTATSSHPYQEPQKTKHMPLFKFRNMKPFGFQLENYPFELLLQKLKPEKLKQLFTALLLERKIVLIKDDIGDIALIMQSLITLISPFQWCFTIITYLTRELVDMLDAPFPFMIGVSTATWEDICTLKDYPEDIYIFDLDSQERRFIPKYEIPDLPQPYGDDLLAGLKDVMDKKDRRLEALRAEIKSQGKTGKHASLSKRQLDQHFDEQYWADAQLSVKQLFFNFLLMAVNNYIQFYRTNDEQGDEAPGDKPGVLAGLQCSDDIFDFDGYLQWQDDHQLSMSGETNSFMQEFVKTQCFHEFIEQNYMGKQDEAESAAVFFESCIELLIESGSLKKLKAAQQEMIDQAKYNLATPVKFKFNGIYSKYVGGLRKREQHLRACLDDLQPEEYKERTFAEMRESEQIDDIIMKYIFLRPEEPDKFRQFSMITSVNQDMVFEKMPRIRYDLVELYWQKMYKAKTGGQSSRPMIDNEPQSMHTNKHDIMQKKRKRQPTNKNEIEYDEYINGNQALQMDDGQLSDQEKQTNSLKNKYYLSLLSVQKKGLLKKNRSGNIIYDTNSQSNNKDNSLTQNKTHDNSLQKPKLDRNSQSTRSFASLSVQKAQRTAYKITNNKQKQSRQQHQSYTTGKTQDYLSLAKQSTESLGKVGASQPKHFKYKKSPNRIMMPNKSTTIDITRAANQTKGQSQRGVKHSRNASKSDRSSNSALAALTAARNNKSFAAQQNANAKAFKLSKMPLTAGRKDANFHDRVRAARQRGSIQYMPTVQTTSEKQATTSSHINTTDRSDMQLQIIEPHEIPPLGLQELKYNDVSDNQLLTLRSKQLPEINFSARVHSQQIGMVEQPDEAELNLAPAYTSFQVKGQGGQTLGGGPLITTPSSSYYNNSLQRPKRFQSSFDGTQKLMLEGPQIRKAQKQQSWQRTGLPLPSLEAEQIMPEYTEKKAVQQNVDNVQISCNINSETNSFIDIIKHDMDEHKNHKENEDDSGDNLGLEDEEQKGMEMDIDENQNVQIKLQMQNQTQENFRDGVNEKIDDEAHMAQKTEYHLQYRPKFNKMNSEEYSGLGSGSRPRQQMMPITSLASVLKKERISENSQLWSQSSQGNISSRASGTYNQLTSQPKTNSSINASLNETINKSINHQASIGSNSTKQAARKTPALPLSMLLSKTESRRTFPSKRLPNEAKSKTRSITEKQLSFDQITRLPSNSLVITAQQKSQFLARPSDLRRPSHQMPSSKNEQESLAEENEDEGWFTSLESKRLSEKMQRPPVIASQETQQKLQDFYSDIDRSIVGHVFPHVRPPAAQEEQMQQASMIARQQNQPQRIGTGHDSPQQSSRGSAPHSELQIDESQGMHPTSAISRTAALDRKILKESPVQDINPSAVHQQEKSTDNSIAEPNNGILFTHSKRRTERYRDEL